MDVIDLRTQQSICLPAQCFIDPVYGTAIVADEISAAIKYFDLCSGESGSADVTVVKMGGPLDTANAEYYELMFGDLGDTPENYPAQVGPMRPGHRYIINVSSSDSEFGAFNIGPFGVTDNRIGVMLTGSPTWGVLGQALIGTWAENGWHWSRKFAHDGRSAGPMFVSDGGEMPIAAADITAWEYQDADPDSIHYTPLKDCYMAFDGYRLHTYGVSGILDGTPWIESGSVTPLYQLLDHTANLSTMPIGLGDAYTVGLGKTIDSWWTAVLPTGAGSSALKGVYQTAKEASARLFLSENTSVKITGDSLRITQDLPGFQILPYRYRVINGDLYQEFGAMYAPDSWWLQYDIDSLDQYTVAHRICIADYDPSAMPVIDYFHPTTFTYGALVIK